MAVRLRAALLLTTFRGLVLGPVAPMLLVVGMVQYDYQNVTFEQ
jgi:hypothetical protein